MIQATPLNEICEFVLDGTHTSPPRTANGIPVLSAQNIVGGELTFKTDRFTSEAEYAAFRKRVHVSEGDVLLTIVGTIGRAAVVRSPRPLVFQRSVAIIRPRHTHLDSRYLFHVTQSPSVCNQLRKATNQSSQAGVYLGRLKQIEIPLPPLDEQRRIAAILDAADSLRAKRRAALAKLDQLAQSIFIEMFGEPDTQKLTIGELLQLGYLQLHKDGNHGSQYPRADEFGDDGIPFLSAQCIDESGGILADRIQRLNFAKAEKLKIGWTKAGDVLLAHNASVGKVALYEGVFPKALIGTSLTAFRPDNNHLTSGYLFAALRSPSFQLQLSKNMSQTTRNQVPITAQRLLEIAVPPIKEQHKFSNLLSKYSEIKCSFEAADEKSELLFISLQHRAFRGEL